MTAALPRVHAVTNDAVATRANFLDLTRRVVTGGTVAVHLRAAAVSGAALFDLALRLRDVLEGTSGLLFVNDRVDVARAAGAGGVHLPARGLPTQAARALVPEGCWVGRSVHGAEEAARAAAEGSDYVFLGPIWETASHSNVAPLGTRAISGARGARIIAIGGVNGDRVRACRDAGAYGVAAIRAIWDAPDPGAVVQKMLLSLEPG